MSAGRPVGTGRLAGLIWDDDQPEHARASLHTLVARLRGLVPGAVATVGDGYLLDVGPDQVDLLRFRRLVREAGAAADPASSLGLLKQALDLWRGEPLAGLRSAALERDVVPGLTDEYLSAVQQRVCLELAAGNQDQVIAELRELAGRYPLREPLWSLLMRALAAVGRPAEAIGEYHRAREILAAQLGLDPSPELQEQYGRLLQAELREEPAAASPAGGGSSAGPGSPDAAPGGVPRRLPADTGVFTGRQAELARLLALGEDGGRGPGAVVISAIDGMAGVGKTALAVHAAHRLADRFGDGQLFIDLHGYTQGYRPRTADQALEAFLRAMSVPPREIPRDTEERAALFRERLARDLAVRGPAGERDAALDRLLGYYQHTALRADARIARYAQPGPAGPAPRHAPALPDPDTARAWLRVERANLSACLRYAVDGGLDARIVALSAGLANLLRTDGPWTTAAAAQAAGVTAARRLGDPAGQARALTELGNLHGLTDDYLGAKTSLEAALNLHRETGDEAGQAYALTMLANVQRLMDDCPGAEVSLRAALELHTTTGDKGGQAHTLIRLGMVRQMSGEYPGAKASQRAALELLQETDDKAGQAQALTQLMNVQSMTGEYEDAIRDGKSALVIFQELGDRLHLANALSKLGVAERLTGDYRSAAGNQQAALDLFRKLGNRLGQANALTELAEVRRLTGDRAGAAQGLGEAIGIFRDLGSRGSLAWALNYQAAVIADTGDRARAIVVYRDALGLAREVGQPDDEAIALHGLGEVHLREGETDDGVACLRAALGIYRRLGMPAADQVARRLAEIDAEISTARS